MGLGCQYPGILGQVYEIWLCCLRPLQSGANRSFFFLWWMLPEFILAVEHVGKVLAVFSERPMAGMSSTIATVLVAVSQTIQPPATFRTVNRINR